MTPEPNLSRATALVWRREIAAHAFTDEEIDELEANNLREKGNPMVAVSLEPDGTPTRWPWTHPDLEHRLRLAQRRRWASDMLAGEWSASRRILLTAERESRRELIARSLLQMLPRVSEGDLPTLACCGRAQLRI